MGNKAGSPRCPKKVPAGVVYNFKSRKCKVVWKPCATRACPECGPVKRTNDAIYWGQIIAEVMLPARPTVWLVHCNSRSEAENLVAFATRKGELAVRVPQPEDCHEVFTTTVNPTCSRFAFPVEEALEDMGYRSLHEFLLAQMERVPPGKRVRPNKHLAALIQEQAEQANRAEGHETEHDPESLYLRVESQRAFYAATTGKKPTGGETTTELPMDATPGSEDWDAAVIHYGLDLSQSNRSPEVATLIRVGRRRRPPIPEQAEARDPDWDLRDPRLT